MKKEKKSEEKKVDAEIENIDFHTKVNAFFAQKTPIHFKLKNGVWGNGVITSVNPDFFIVLERKNGEVPVFFKELKIITIIQSRGGED